MMSPKPRKSARPCRKLVRSWRGAKRFPTPNSGGALAMSRALEWTPAAERDLRRIDSQLRERIRQAVYRFADTGHGDVVKVQGVTREWRLRVGEWRIRFTEDPTSQTIIILRVRPRGEAYR